MRHSKTKATLCLITSLLFFSNRTAYANFDVATPGQDRRGCGDYSILLDSRDRAIFDRHCGTNEDKDFEILRDLVGRLDPKREAHAAASRGDFRLAALTGGGPPPPDRIKLWDLEGIHCKSIDDNDVFIWIRLTDALTGPISSFQGHMLMFAAAYNKALISEPSFPSRFACTSIANVK